MEKKNKPALECCSSSSKKIREQRRFGAQGWLRNTASRWLPEPRSPATQSSQIRRLPHRCFLLWDFCYTCPAGSICTLLLRAEIGSKGTRNCNPNISSTADRLAFLWRDTHTLRSHTGAVLSLPFCLGAQSMEERGLGRNRHPNWGVKGNQTVMAHLQMENSHKSEVLSVCEFVCVGRSYRQFYFYLWGKLDDIY